MKTELELALKEYCVAKENEDYAKERRYAAEAKILNLVDKRSEGQVSELCGPYKVVTKYKINRTIDAKKWEQIKGNLHPDIANHIVDYKPALVLKGYRWIEENDPQSFAELQKAITSSAAKPSISVEIV